MINNKKDSVIRSIIYIQSLFKFKKKMTQKLLEEGEKQSQLMFNMMEQIQENYKTHVRVQSLYNEQMENLELIVTEHSKINETIHKIKIRNITFKIYLDILKKITLVQHRLRESMHSQGIKQLSNLLYLELQIDIMNISTKHNYGWWIHFLNNVYVPLTNELYCIDTHDKIYHLSSSKNDKKGKPFQFSSIHENITNKQNVTEDKNVIVDILKNNNFTPIFTVPTQHNENISLVEQLHGAKCYLPIPFHTVGNCSYVSSNFKTYVIVMSGYFKDDSFQLLKCYKHIKDKYNNLNQMLTNSTHINFNRAWINQLSLRDIIVYDINTLYNMCIKAYQKLQSLTSKTISNLVKEFLSGSAYVQRDILTTFLMLEDDNETQCLAYLMYDMISQESYLLKPQPLAEQIYNSLHWTIQKKFKVAIENAGKNMKNANFTEEDINYESRIYLMKCSEQIKKKCFDKLKEIQNKSNENSVKAQQYLDGLLKIPFGFYKKEQIFCFLNDFKEQFIDYCQQYASLGSYVELSSLHRHISQQKSLSAHQIQSFLTQLSDGYKNIVVKDVKTWHPEIIREYFNTFTNLQLNDYITQIKKNLHIRTIEYISSTGKKIKVRTSYKKAGVTIKLENSEIVESLMDWITHCKENDLKSWTIISMDLPIKGRSESFSQVLQYEQQFKKLMLNWDGYTINRQQYLKEVRNILENSVYGHHDVKRHIEHIIAQWIHGENTGYCFGFEGPPGTGKTSIAKKGLANCFKDNEGNSRPFAFIALGGSSNGSTLEGHSYTYVGSTWGKIVDILMETKCMNPIIYIDELDKVSQTEHGREIIGILTHITDPSQNDEFMDKYFAGVKLDLTKVLFIFSYNDPDKIDPILRDRIHRIRFNPLKRKEKKEVCRLHILPFIMKSVGLSMEDIIFDDETLEFIIENYTLEGGARKLKERLFEIVCEINLRHLIEPQKYVYPIQISCDMLTNDIFADKPIIKHKCILPYPRVGLSNGMYASTTGVGGLTVIECYKIPSTTPMTLELTGQQGEVMKESMSVAKTVAWNLLTPETKSEIAKTWKNEGYFGLHIHCPEGAVPKDGPSAGGAITVSLVSALLELPVNNMVSMTGEIDLNGHICQIGGLETKIWGAKKAGVSKVLFPSENKHDLEQILKSEEVPFDEGFTYRMVDNIWDILEEVFPNSTYPFTKFGSV